MAGDISFAQILQPKTIGLESRYAWRLDRRMPVIKIPSPRGSTYLCFPERPITGAPRGKFLPSGNKQIKAPFTRRNVRNGKEINTR